MGDRSGTEPHRSLINPYGRLLIVLSLYLEIALRMLAYRTNLRSLLAYDNVAAVRALPNHVLVAGEHETALHVFKEFPVSLLVGLLDGAYLLEQEGDVIEAFLLRCLGETRIHICPLVVLAGCSVRQVYGRFRDFPAVKELEPYLRMLFLILSRLLEQLAYLHIAVLDGLRCIIEVLGMRLGFPGESRHEVLLCLGAFQFCHNK